MDNLTHSLVGWALAETGLKLRSRKGLAACVLAANMPDLDVFFGWAPWEPLATHRGFTHGLLGGVLLMPPLLAALLWLLDWWQVRSGRSFASGLPMRPGWLLVLCYLGAITHPLLDLQNTYSVQLLSLASTRWFHADGLFIVSPWLLAILAVGIWLARRRRTDRPAVLALIGAVAFIGLNVAISAGAWTAPTIGQPTERGDRMFASPQPLLFWKRNLIWRHAGTIYFADYDPVRRAPIVSITYVADGMNLPEVRAAIVQDAPAVHKFLAWSQMPIAAVRRSGCTATVTFGDGRYTGPRLSRNFRVATQVPVRVPGCP